MQAKFNLSQATTIASSGDAMSQPRVVRKISLILGPPGTGKTYTLQGLIKALLQGVSGVKLLQILVFLIHIYNFAKSWSQYIVLIF